ncbi:MAG: FAD-dependent oxidoreductase [Pseudomonadota bacterium]
MQIDPRYAALFEPLKIGPVTTKNRFYQVPHCTGMGYLRPQTLAAMRGVKAEGAWGVICTEYNSIHPSSDDLPHVSASLWDDSDIRAHSLMTDLVHEHGSLAGAELWYSGARSPNLYTREVPMDVASLPNLAGHPFQTRAMDKTDIRNLRRWHRKAALRAREAGFDIVYVYATHGYLLDNFLDPRINTRTDEYGGSLENRVRLVRELIEETKEAVGDRCGVAVRFKADESIGEDGAPEYGERQEMFEILSELPDLWDINIADYSLEMGVSRFTKEGALEPYMKWVKQVTSKPIVTVGRYTSPDAMVGLLKRGVADLVGAARPSIADPFLPKKIEQGRIEDIRECIGCNVCYSGDSTGTPIRCTQNPTMGEEWRKGWHPEQVLPVATDATILVIGAGPAGLEAARALGARGYSVMLAEATRELGGRVVREASLPGMNEYIRVRDYREQQLLKMPNVEVFRESKLTANDVFDVRADHVAIATGASWRKERFDGKTFVPIACDDLPVFTPDDIMNGKMPDGPTIVFDSDNYYMASVVAERIRETGVPVTYVTAEDSVSSWAGKTSERWRIHTRLLEKGIKTITAHSVLSFDGHSVTLSCEYSGAEHDLTASAVVMVTQRVPNDTLYHKILEAVEGDEDKLPFTLKRIGDADAPAIIAAAVYAGHRFAVETDTIVDVDMPLKHDRIDVGPAFKQLPAIKSGYLETLVQYYEEEIAGEAYFMLLAEKLADPEDATKMHLLGKVERHCAEIVAPLIEKYGLTVRPREELLAEGRYDAESAPDGFPEIIARMRETFPAYIADFKALESMAPPQDLPILKRMTEHELVAIAFLEAEYAGSEDATAPLLSYLSTPVDTSVAA